MGWSAEPVEVFGIYVDAGGVEGNGLRGKPRQEYGTVWPVVVQKKEFIEGAASEERFNTGEGVADVMPRVHGSTHAVELLVMRIWRICCVSIVLGHAES